MRYETFLPIPPTANHLFIHNKKTNGRFPSPHYKAWRKRAAKDFQYTGPVYTKRLHAIYKFVFPDKRVRDIANFEKAISDFLVEHKVIEDDSQIDHLELIRAEGTIPGVFIQVEAL